MVISKKTISRFILIILILDPSILLGFAPAVQAIRQIVTAVATASPQVIEFVKNSANAIVVMATNPPQPPPHVQDELKKIMLNSKMAAAKAQAAGLKPFPKFTTIAAKMPAALKAHAIAQVALSANGSHHQLMAAVKEKITMMKVSPAKIPIAAAAKGAQHFAHNITKIPTVQIAVTQSMAKPTITMVPIQSAAAPSAIIKQTAANIPSQFTKNTIVAAATHQTGNNPKAVISAAHSLPAQQTVHRARTVATPPASLPAQQTGSRVQVTMGNGDLIVSDLQAINNNHAAFVAHENQRIFNNPHLKSIFASQKITVSENLKQACNLSCTPEIIKAQLTLLNNSYVHQAENFDLQYATKKMIGEITDSNGEFIGCLSQKTADKLSHFASMKVSVGDFFVNCWTSIRKAVGFTPDISQKFVENSYNTNLYNFCENILKKQIDESEHFLTLIKPNHPYDYCPKCKIHAIMHIELFALKFNEHLIPRTFEQDPLWPSLKKVLDQLRPQKNIDWIHQICSTKSQLESRHNIVQFLLQKLNRQIDQPAPAILYDVAATYENPSATVEYLAKLSSDHPEAPIREAHSIIFGTQTLPKIYDYPHLERLKDVITFSKDLFLEKFNDLRAIYLRLTTLQPETEEGTAGMRQGFIYAQKALESDTHRALYKNLAKEILQALTNPESDQTIFSWPDFSKTFSNPFATQIQQRILPLLNHALADRHLPSDSPDSMVQMQRAHAAGAIEHISKIFHALANNDVTTALNIEKTVLPHFTRNFFEEELKKCNAKSSFTANQVIESTVAARMILSNAQSAAAPTLVAPSQHTSEMPMIKGSDLRKPDSEASNVHQKTYYTHENNAEHQKAKQHHNNAGGGAQSSIDPEDPEDEKDNEKSKEEPKREVVLPRMQTYEQARNKALEIIGEVDPHSGNPHIGTVGIGEGKIVGRRWHGRKVTVRLDYDPKKGPHINVADYRAGKGSSGNVVAIPFEGNLETVESLLRHLNK